MKYLVIYHKNCADGFCAAWLIKRFAIFGGDARFHAAQYGEEPPWELIDGDTFVVIADFSYKRDVLLTIESIVEDIIVLDHHKTAEAELSGLDFCRFDMNKSGARMVGEWIDSLNGPYITKDNWLVDYTEDRDLWRWRLPDSREVSAGLSSYPMDFLVWSSIYSDGPGPLAQEGRAILRYQQQIVENHIRHAREVTVANMTVKAVNATVLFSEIAGALAKDKPFGVAWFQRSDGKYQYSLRSAPDGVDVADIASTFGGGGHKHAAGFESDSLLFQE